MVGEIVPEAVIEVCTSLSIGQTTLELDAARRIGVCWRFCGGPILARKALIVWGGWDGHQPREVKAIFQRVLTADGFDVEVSDTLDSFKDEAKLQQVSLIVPVWTMGEIRPEQVNPVINAVNA